MLLGIIIIGNLYVFLLLFCLSKYMVCDDEVFYCFLQYMYIILYLCLQLCYYDKLKILS